MKKGIVLLALAACLMLGGCGRESVPVETEPNHVTLTVVTSYGGDDGNRSNFVAAVEEYEAATGVTVQDNSAASNEEWKTKVLTDFMTGSEPDVLFYFTDADADPFINAGRNIPTTPPI